MKFMSLFVLLTVSLSGSFSLARTLKALPRYRTSEFQNFIAGVNGSLPQRLQKVVGEYQVGFFDSKRLPKDFCSEDVSYDDLVKVDVFAFRKRIYLHSYFWKFLKTGSRGGFPCGSQSPQEMAKKALIFQLAQIYDRSDLHFRDKASQERIQRCTAQYREENGQWSGSIPTICSYYLFSNGHLSEAPAYKNLADYKGKLIRSKNHLDTRLGNAHQLKSPGTHFALNFAQFLTDPSYQCRRPSFQTYFSQLLAVTPFSPTACEPISHIFTSSASWKIDIAPAKVYQVHFLFASKGQEMMSRWGHSMLRLVVCAPERTTVGPECLGDVAYHLVLSYRANVNDVIINYWDGLTGGYPSQIMTFSMPEIVDEYTRGQWRDLISLPLNVTEAQKNLLVQSALEHFWSYSGEYKFITNNCASEADQLLRAVLPNTHPYQDVSVMTPKGMYEKLARYGIIDLRLLKDRKEAQRKGYFFPSQKKSLDKAFGKISSRFPKYQSLEQWAHESKADERRQVYETFDTFPLIGSSYILEKYVELVHTLEQQKRLARLLQTKERQDSLKDIIAHIVDSASQRLPWKLTQGGYGVPVLSETMNDDAVTERWQEAVKWGLEYRKAVVKMFPDIDQEMAGIKANLELLIHRRSFSASPDQAVTE